MMRIALILIFYMLEEYLRSRGAGDTFPIRGMRPSLPSSIYDSMEKHLHWHNVFGVEMCSENPLLKYIILTGINGKSYWVSVDERVLSPTDIFINLNGSLVEDRAGLVQIAQAIREQIGINHTPDLPLFSSPFPKQADDESVYGEEDAA